MSTALNDCHPERSLATSAANRQTKSKDLVLAGSITGAKRNSHFAARLTCFWLLLLILSVLPSLGQTYRSFHGRRSELVSPNGRYVLQNAVRDEDPPYLILLKDKTAQTSRKVYEYGRDASAVWSPDSRHFAINDYAGSDYTETNIFSVEDASSKIDVQDAIFHSDKLMRERVALVGWGHDYFGVVRWLDEQRVVVHHWGHNDEPPLGSFCTCYIYTIGKAAKRCAQQPKGDDPETLCSNLTP